MSVLVKRKYIYGRACFFNNNNLPDLAPFEYEEDTDTLWVEADQYDAWASTDALGLLDFKSVQRLDRPARRLEARAFYDAPPWFTRVYKSINRRSNACRWWSELIFKDGVILVNKEQSLALAISDKDMMEETYRARAWLKNEFQTIMDAHPDVREGWFVKCGTCSTKHQYPVEPVFSGAEAVVHLLEAEPIREALLRERAECFVIRPWDPNISSNNEFRVFVRQGKVTGISQQACFSHVVNIVALFSPESIFAAAQKCYDECMLKLPPERRLVYECTFDAFLSSPGGEPIIHLIEINAEAFGWGPAGASLFEWRKEPPPFVDEQPVLYVTE